MCDHAVAGGVSPREIVLDYAGRGSHESCHRVRCVFRVAGAVLIAQSNHVDGRGLFSANRLSFVTVGMGSAPDGESERLRPLAMLAVARSRAGYTGVGGAGDEF